MKVLIADDHPLVREALQWAVRRAYAQAEVFEAHDLASVQSACRSQAPDLALLDLNMPGMNGLDGLRQIRQQYPQMKLIVASAQEDPPTIRAVLASGAAGFFPKSAAPQLLVQALHLVHAGGVYVPAGVLADYLDGQPPANAKGSGLTPRQLVVLRLLLRGGSNKHIARELDLTEGTVKIHIAAILRALRVRSRTEAVVRAHQLGLDDTGP